MKLSTVGNFGIFGLTLPTGSVNVELKKIEHFVTCLLEQEKPELGIEELTLRISWK